MGAQSYSLQTATGANGFQQVLDSNGNNIASAIQGAALPANTTPNQPRPNVY